MARYDGILLCSDFDGTLASHGTVSDENIAAVRSFMEQGGLFTLATGRPFDKIDMGIVPNTHIVCFNGAAIYDHVHKEYLFKGPLPNEARELSEEIFAEFDSLYELIFYGFDKNYTYKRGDSDRSGLAGEFAKIIFMVDPEYSDETMEAISKKIDHSVYNLSRSGRRGIELLRVDCTKGDSVRRLRSILGDRIDKVVCVGDYENDITMLREADIGYAVGNALESVKAVADRITLLNTEHAIARIISEL